MKKSHRIALKPTPEQEALFGQHAGYARFAYNWAVSEFRTGLDRWRVAERAHAAPSLEQGQGRDRTLGVGAVAERGQVRHHRLGPSRRRLGRVLPQGEGWPASQSPGGLSPFQAAQARAGFPRR